MKVEFKKSFVKDVKSLQDKKLKRRIKSAISSIENAETLEDIDHLKKLKGANNYYRIRIGDFRFGLAIEGQKAICVRCLHRRDIYRYIP